jgi:fermentation-respiration switch protein FrsA (DUF1100 family)
MRRPVCAAVLVLVLAAAAGCTGMFFLPYRGHVLTPERIGLKYEDVYFESRDGVRLHAWFLPAQGTAQATVLHLHGNAENISTHIGNVYWMPARGFNVFLLDYRGYGLSLGSPSVEGALEDVDSAMQALLGRADVDRSRMVVFGQSLGGALAIHYVAHSSYRQYVCALIVESAFSSYREITREKLADFWLTWPLQYPLSWTVNDDYSPLRAVGWISPIPLLILHGDKDPIVPLHHGLRLYEAAREPKALWVVPGGGHTEAMRDDALRDRLTAYIRNAVSPGGP